MANNASANLVDGGNGSMNGTVKAGTCPSLTKTTDSYPTVSTPASDFTAIGTGGGQAGRDGGYVK